MGYGSLGLIGTGRGGGGDGKGTLGVGSLDTIGLGRGRTRGSGYGRPGLALGERSAKKIRLRPGTATVKGTLPKAVIRRVIRRHTNEIRFCYERGLQKRPDLFGRVLVRFLIFGDGVVKSVAVKESTVADSEVAGCIARTIRRMTFPTPEDGGLVIVTYPFILTSSQG